MQGFVAILLSAIAALPHTSSRFGSVGLFEVVSTFRAWVDLLSGHLNEVVGVFASVEHSRRYFGTLTTDALMTGPAYCHAHLL